MAYKSEERENGGFYLSGSPFSPPTLLPLFRPRHRAPSPLELFFFF
jgi:hypothetical protein